MGAITCVEDLRRLARRRVPRMFFDYLEGGSYSESTLHANRLELQRLALRQRVARDISRRELGSRMLGRPVSLPLALAPTGLCGMLHADGEIHAARAAEKAGVPFTLSTMSICSIEDVRAHTSAPFWFQLYVIRDRDFLCRLLERARQAGCSALMLTLDLPVMGQRHRDVKNGLTAPPRPTPRNLLDLLRRPAWCRDMLRTPRRQFGNIVGHARGVTDGASLAAWHVQQFDSSLGWDDVAWIKGEWGGPLIVKGILDAEDARSAVAAGADAVVVSNHGGRQLDGAPATIRVLPQIAAAVGQDADVWLDSGIRTGQDILRALAYGASAVLVGRAFLYGLAAQGEAGVTRVLDILRQELDVTLALCGLTALSQVDARVLYAD
ncbi:alpha-hydroxy acid oxidase [Azohydromonas australica]|uniref:alpha-hydroxy acid oxidase n=1 Tax=Azohydromonas australica TaxID=364039 RepID=UPI00041F55F2|nr:alpha-hydroxy acid oxidase [Azohydromonas australica]